MVRLDNKAMPLFEHYFQPKAIEEVLSLVADYAKEAEETPG